MSTDAAIAIAFGLIGAIMSLLGILVACLTLRFMILEKCTPPDSIFFITPFFLGLLEQALIWQMSGGSEEKQSLCSGTSISIPSRYLRGMDRGRGIRGWCEVEISLLSKCF